MNVLFHFFHYIKIINIEMKSFVLYLAIKKPVFRTGRLLKYRKTHRLLGS